MLVERAVLAILAVRALSALASPVHPFTVQDSGLHVVSDSICGDIETSEPPEGPEVRLDDAVFVGKRKGNADHFLGIPFALPP